MYRYHFVAAVVIAFFSILNHDGQAADWPSWRGPNLDGISTETGLIDGWGNEGPKVLWKAEIGIGFSSFATADGKVLAIGNKNNQDTVYCFQAADGTEVWKYTYDAPLNPKYYEGGPGSTPSIDDGQVYVISKVGHVTCLNFSDGAVIWQKHLINDFGAKMPTWGFAGSPLILGDELLIDAGVILSLDKTTGAVNWKTQDYGSAYSTVVPCEMDGREMLVCFPKSGLVLLDRAGKELAKLPWDTKHGVNDTTPLVRGNGIYIITGYKKGEGLAQFKDGALTLKWSRATPHGTAQMSNSVYYEGHIYGFNGDQLRCLDSKTMKPAWSNGSFGMGTMLLADGKQIILSDKGELALAKLQSDSYQELARHKMLDDKCWTVPVLSDGRLFIRSTQGHMLCVDLRKQ
ncbi:PQQ-like beta-propeller repeat protein [Candidatus Sumerlaeota bacterium]|nr:PQQ-like beta-propeller repeat protein [Candidatus Sumerlaeota bacterium]